mgnify:CR=1 FL=1
MQYNDEIPLLIVISGPTAVGKTRLSIELAKKNKTSIFSSDSRQFYRELSIGTAKPSEALLKQYPHHLVNICEPHENYSVGQFYHDVSTAIQLILKKGKVPLLVGGTMMYFRALQQGLSKLPASNSLIIGQESDAINKADTNASVQVPFDILGVSRLASPDIGAYQHIIFEEN